MRAKIFFAKLVAVLGGVLYFLEIVEGGNPYCSSTDGFAYTCYNYKSFPVNFDYPKNVATLSMYSGGNSVEKLKNGLLLTSNLLNLQNLDLDGCHIKEIEMHAFRGGDNLASLDLRRNSITNLDLNVFEGLQNLKSLNLNGNPLKQFSTGSVFPKLTLGHLFMDNCKIETVNLDIFENLENLQTLNLANNPFKEFNTVAEFPRINLTSLNLSNCSMKSVHPILLRNLGKLTHLFLSNNLLKVIDWKVFYSLQKLKDVRLDGNPLYCDCRLMYVLELLDQKSANWMSGEPTCNSSFYSHNLVSQNSSGALMQNPVNRRFLVCPPEISLLYTIEINSNISKKFQIQLDNRTNLQKVFSLGCEYKGYPEPIVSWTVDGKPLTLDSPAITKTICLQGLEVSSFCSIFKQTLTIVLPITFQNESRIQCQVENSGGLESKKILVDFVTRGKSISIEPNGNVGSPPHNDWNSLFKIVIGCFTLVVLLLLANTILTICFGFYNFKNSRNLVTHELDKAVPPNLAGNAQTRSNFDEPQYPPLLREAVNPSYELACSDDMTIPENVYEMPVLSY